MATITLPVMSLYGTTEEVFLIEELSFARSITRQGKGARAAWRHHLAQLRFPVTQSNECDSFDVMRSLYASPLHGIRAEHRRRMAEQQRIDDAWRPIEEQSAPGADDR